MKLPLDWLTEFVRLSPSELDALPERLLAAGVEVAGAEESGGERVLEVEITPNRGDLLSVFGLAREIACVSGKAIRQPSAKKIDAPARRGFVRIDPGSGCRRYLGARISGVRIGSSPAAVLRKLQAAQFAAFNNAVDATNLILAELGQPLHAFDADKLAGSIHVRRARQGERLAALDGKTYDVAGDLVIADDARPVALAGVIGGSETAVTASTKNIFLECAWFEPAVVRRTCRRLSIATESSYRFERAVDPAGLERAFSRAIDLIEDLTGGRLEWLSSAGAPAKPPPRIMISAAEVERVLGVDLPGSKIQSHLTAVGCKLSRAGAGRWNVFPPSHRQDLLGAHDLVEEVARLHGLGRIPSRAPVVRPSVRSEERETLGRVRRAALSCGLVETVHLSFVDEKTLSSLGVAAAEAVALENPLSLAASHLRPTLLPGLLSTASLNLRRDAATEIRLFETGVVFLPGVPPREELRMGIILCGNAEPPHFSRKTRPADFFDLKGVVDAVLASSGRHPGRADYVPAEIPGFQSGSAAAVQWGAASIGCLGRISSGASRHFDFAQDVYAAELSLSRVLGIDPVPLAHRPLPRFPSIRRDLSLLLKQTVHAGDVRREVFGANLPDLVKVDIFDLYHGKGLPEGAYALGVTLIFQSPSRSLSDDEANAARDAAFERLRARLGAAQR